MAASMTVVVEFELGGGEGGGAYEVAVTGASGLGALVAQGRAEAEDLVAGGCEWAAVRVGLGGVEDIDAETGVTVYVAEGV